MKEYIKMFDIPNDGDNYIISSIPFTCLVKSTKQYLVCNTKRKKLININNILQIVDTKTVLYLNNDTAVELLENIITKRLISPYKDKLIDINISNNVNSIGLETFSDCSNLNKITIPNTVTNIGNYAFLNCTNLLEMNYIGTKSDWDNIHFSEYWNSNSSLNIIHCLDGDIFLNTVLWLNDGSIVQLCDDSNIINQTDISNKYKDTLLKCKIGNNITNIDNYTFFYCTNLNMVVITNNVTNIGNYAFNGCSSLTELTIPNSITNIGDRAFYDCNNLTNIKYNGTKAEWNNIQFGNNWKNNSLLNTIHCLDGDINI